MGIMKTIYKRKQRVDQIHCLGRTVNKGGKCMLKLTIIVLAADAALAIAHSPA